MLREVKFYARDILRGPNAKTMFGYFVFAGVSAVAVGAVVGFAVFGFVEYLKL